MRDQDGKGVLASNAGFLAYRPPSIAGAAAVDTVLPVRLHGRSRDRIDVDEDGSVYVADSGNYRVHRFTRGGGMARWGGRGGRYLSGWTVAPDAGLRDLALDRHGWVYVVESSG